MNVPTRITIARICLIPIMTAIFFIEAIPYNYLISTIIFVIAALTDFLDGHLARKNGEVTTLGKFLDQIADKMLITAALILIICGAKVNIFQIIVAVSLIIITMRDFAVSAIRMLAASSNVVIPANMGGKIKTVSQSIAVPILMAAFDIGALLNFDYKYLYIAGLVMLAISVVLTIWTGIDYIYKSRKFLADK